ncbi:MAG: hypothetical protein IJO27_03595 [Bacilli bacterium]|nr:hypothetical protein [Bacilli bacterium]
MVDEEDRVIEGYDDFDAAIKSDYIALYCDLNNYLKYCIIEYFNNNE